jgi:S-adenosyl-L-methionine hydrolase (adenosine-forming)
LEEGVPGRPIVFISDFGLDDEFVGICHGVIARIAPDSRIVDLTHGVPPQDVVRAALVLAESLLYVPDDAVFLALVDPGVGTARRAVAVRTGDGALLVGPDNGVLSQAWTRLGGAAEAIEITSPDVVLPGGSHTFHGRDVFAPAAAHLANGMALGELGPSLDVESLTRVAPLEPEVHPGRLHAEVLGIDRFGNVQLSIRPEHLDEAGLADETALQVRTVWRAIPVRRVSTFGEVSPGELAALIDSRGWLAVVRNAGSAAASLRLELGNPVVVERPG